MDRVCGCFSYFATDCLPRRRKRGGRRAVNNDRHERQTRRLADSSEQKGKSDGCTRKRLLEIETTQTTRQPPPSWKEKQKIDRDILCDVLRSLQRQEIDKQKKKKKKKVKWYRSFLFAQPNREYGWKSSRQSVISAFPELTHLSFSLSLSSITKDKIKRKRCRLNKPWIIQSGRRCRIE